MLSILCSYFSKCHKSIICSIGLILLLGCCILVSSKTVLALGLDGGTYLCREVYPDDHEYNFQARLTLYPASAVTSKGSADCSKMNEVIGIWRSHLSFEWSLFTPMGTPTTVQDHIYRCMSILHILSGDCDKSTNWIKQ